MNTVLNVPDDTEKDKALISSLSIIGMEAIKRRIASNGKKPEKKKDD